MRWPAVVLPLLVMACGSSPPPKAPPPPEPAPTQAPPTDAPVMTQELGSIDDGAVEETFDKLGSDLEACHSAGRARIGQLAGDVSIFLRIDARGHVKYAYFDSSTLGERGTEKCILDLVLAATWPAPKGGEAEVRHSLGWDGGQERRPLSWESEKVIFALDASSPTRRAIDKCKRGSASSIALTGYVVNGAPPPAQPDPAKQGKKKPKRKKPARAKREPVGHFKTLGGASPTQDGADRVDCAIAIVKELALPSPGSTTAKVSFSL